MAKLDWLFGYAAANANTYGDQSDAVKQRLIADAGSDYTDAQKSGIINQDGSVNWDKVPKQAPNVQLPQNVMWNPVNGRGGMVDPYTMKPRITGPIYNDPNYGQLTPVQAKTPDDLSMRLGRGLALGAFGGITASVLAPLIGSALGVGSGWNTAIGSVIKAVPGLAMSGGQGLGQLAGSIAGGATGLPGGSFVGGQLGSFAQMTPAQRAALQQMIGGH